MSCFSRFKQTRHAKLPKPSDDPFDLDRPLLWVTPSDAWRIRDACEGTAILGQTGSCKTSGSGETIAKTFLATGLGGLVLTAKVDEALLWQRYAQETGRTKDLFFFRRKSPGVSIS